MRLLLAACLALTATGCQRDAAPDEARTPVGTAAPVETVTAVPQAGSVDVAGRWITPAIQRSDAILPDGTARSDADGRPLGYPGLGKPLPDVTGAFLDGTPFSTADLAGRWTVIDVWGLWCSDCMADAPYAAALSVAVDQDPDLDFITFHTPPSASRADEAYGKYGSVEAFFAARGYSYPVVLDRDASLRTALGIAWTPTYLLIAPDLTVQGFTTDLSVARGEPVKALLQEVAAIRARYPNP